MTLIKGSLKVNEVRYARESTEVVVVQVMMKVGEKYDNNLYSIKK